MSELVMPNTPKKLEPASYEDVFHLMVNGAPREFDDGTPSIPLSFTDNMALMRATNPHVFLFTANSAIPVADSVRGYYEERGEPIPELGIIKADSFVSPHPGYTIYNQAFDSEVQRLGVQLFGARVAVVDQDIHTGFTITMARKIAQAAGATSVIIPEGANWYGDADDQDVDRDAVTSKHSDHMRKVGHAAAQR
jgi:hypothetical protein